MIVSVDERSWVLVVIGRSQHVPAVTTVVLVGWLKLAVATPPGIPLETARESPLRVPLHPVVQASWTRTVKVAGVPDGTVTLGTVGEKSAPVILGAAATYGPTSGPPVPTGAAPAGSTEAVLVSAMARARFSRPLPVWSSVPAASALRARRDTMTPLLAVGSAARRRAAAAATSAEEAEVPVIVVVPSPVARVTMSVPGAARNVSAPSFEDALSASFSSVLETPMTPRSPAGNAGRADASLPVAATTTTLWAQA